MSGISNKTDLEKLLKVQWVVMIVHSDGAASHYQNVIWEKNWDACTDSSNCWDWQDKSYVIARCHQNNQYTLHRWCVMSFSGMHCNTEDVWSNAPQTTWTSGLCDQISVSTRVFSAVHLWSPKTHFKTKCKQSICVSPSCLSQLFFPVSVHILTFNHPLSLVLSWPRLSWDFLLYYRS